MTNANETSMTKAINKENPGIQTFVYVLLSFTVWTIVDLRFGILSYLVQYVFLNGSGVTPVLTYATYPFSVLVFLYAYYKLLHISRYAVIYAMSVPVFAIILFEILWHFFGIFSANYPYWSAPLNSETKLSYSVRYILNEELKGVWGEQSPTDSGR